MYVGSSQAQLVRSLELRLHSALQIKVETANWVYLSCTGKPLPAYMKVAKKLKSAFRTKKSQPAVGQAKRKAGALFSTMFSSSPGANTSSGGVEDLSQVIESNILLKIFTAEVDVQLTKSMSAELLRATKKNPPAKFKYQLLYVCSVAHLLLSTC